MRLARFSLNDSPRYAFVQKDETDGKDYHFLSVEEFLRRREAGFFAEWALSLIHI